MKISALHVMCFMFTFIAISSAIFSSCLDVSQYTEQTQEKLNDLFLFMGIISLVAAFLCFKAIKINPFDEELH